MILKIHKKENFSIVDNALFQRDDVSARAKGLYGYLMTLPPDWKVYKGEITKHFTEGRDALSTAWKELEALGYITKETIQGEDGKFTGTEYTIHESLDRLPENPNQTDRVPEKPKSDKPKSENPQLLNTDLKQKTNKTKGNSDFIPPTYEEVAAYCQEKGYSIPIETFMDYYETANPPWTYLKGSRRVKVSNWKQCVVTWNRKNRGGNQSTPKKASSSLDDVMSLMGMEGDDE